MKISDQELTKIIREAVEKKVSQIKEGSDFSARRQIVHSAESASMDFEREIVALLGVKKPDELQSKAQKHYYMSVEKMKEKIVQAVMEATKDLARLPKNDPPKK